MNRVVVLLGPTGVGKTGASVLLARDLGTEIISADSMQIYRGMDVGTAKPSAEERAAVRHHMIDILDPSGAFSAGAYVAAVRPLLEELLRQGKTPLVVGGTGLYVRALSRGIFSGPGADPGVRQALLAMEQKQEGSLYRRLCEVDAEAAARISSRDLRRIVRALEVWITAGEKISLLQEVRTEALPFQFIKIGLTRSRGELYRRIDRRVDDMVGNGLFEEVGMLRKVNPGRIPLQAIGYKEIMRHLDGDLGREEAVRLVKRNSRRYARRQYIWFRKEEDIEWVDVSGADDDYAVFEALRTCLKNRWPDIWESRQAGVRRPG